MDSCNNRVGTFIVTWKYLLGIICFLFLLKLSQNKKEFRLILTQHWQFHINEDRNWIKTDFYGQERDLTNVSLIVFDDQFFIFSFQTKIYYINTVDNIIL